MRVILDLQNGFLERLIEGNPLVVVLLCLMVLDVVTGLIAAFVAKKLCSTASYRGMLGKVQVLAMVATSMLVELVIPNVPWGTIVSFFFCVTEALSITENAANSGVPIPEQWVETLRKAKQKEAEKRKPVVSVIVGEDSGIIHEAVSEGVEETKQAIRKGVHDIRDTLNENSLKVAVKLAQAEAAEAERRGGSDIHV